MNKGQIASFLSDVDQTDLSPIQKQTIHTLIERHTKPVEKPFVIRKVKAKDLCSLEDWEARIARLDHRMMAHWIEDAQFCPALIQEMIEEFRIDMISKNKQYANFKSAFQSYILKGYLSKKIGQLKLGNSPYRDKSATQIFTRGVNL